MSRPDWEAPRDAGGEEAQDMVSAGLFEALIRSLGDQRAGPDEVHRLLRTANLRPPQRAAIESGLDLLRGDLIAARRRRDELEALFVSIRELAEEHDQDLLLDRLVRRAHSLLSADLTWLAEIDPDTHELVVRTTEGAVSPELRGVRVESGRGMAWHVASHRVAHCAIRYHGDTVFPHDTLADRVLSAEGVVSALGVPLVAGDEVIGTLFVANRLEVVFAPESVALLTAFADHASVLLKGARLLAQARQSAAEARRSRGELASHVAEMERAQRDRSELTDCVLRGDSAFAVVRTLSRALGRRVRSLDDALGGEPVLDPPAGDVAAAIAQSRVSGRFTPASDENVAGVVAVVAGGVPLGALVIDGPEPLGAIAQNTVEDAARAMALLRIREDALVEADEKVRGELLSELLDARPVDLQSVQRRARARGLVLEELVTVLLVSAGQRTDEVARLSRGLSPAPTLVSSYGGDVVMLFDREDEIDREQIWRRLRDRLDCPVLLVESSPATAVGELGGRYREARNCMRLLPALGITDRATTTAPFRLYTRLFEPSAAGIGDFVQSTIGALLTVDSERGTDLVGTVDAFARCNTSIARTGRAMHLHPNTVVQRLDRVGALLGEDWRTPDSFFQIQVATRLEMLRRAVG